MWETWFRSLGQKDPLEVGMATHSSILAWRIPMDRGAWWVTVHGVSESDTAKVTEHACISQRLYSILPVATPTRAVDMLQ